MDHVLFVDISDGIKIFLSIITLFIAYKGLTTWNEQLRGTHKFRVRKKVILLLNKLENKIDTIQELSQNIAINQQSAENKIYLRNELINPNKNSVIEDLQSLSKNNFRRKILDY
jgi:hypothetical protein